MADCRETIRDLETFLDGELTPEMHEAINGHLAECLDCLGAVEFHHGLREIIREKCRNDEIPADFVARLESCLNEDFDGDGQIG